MFEEINFLNYLLSLHKEYREVKRVLLAIIILNLKIEARLISPWR